MYCIYQFWSMCYFQVNVYASRTIVCACFIKFSGIFGWLRMYLWSEDDFFLASTWLSRARAAANESVSPFSSNSWRVGEEEGRGRRKRGERGGRGEGRKGGERKGERREGGERKGERGEREEKEGRGRGGEGNITTLFSNFVTWLGIRSGACSIRTIVATPFP